jgi:1-acyl-sn-glycerol-3-phosphate acyltransferase
MGVIFYRTLRSAARFIRIQAIRQTQLNADRADRDDGFVLACTHISHIEPLVLSAAMRRQVHWVSRREFYRFRISQFVLNAIGAVEIDRFGSALVGVRAAAKLAAAGQCVGIFPEGGVAQGQDSVLSGGAIKGGMCSIAIDANVPIVPVVMLGTDILTSVRSWIPPPRKQVCFAFGRDICPPASGESRHARRVQMTGAVEQEFRRVYSEIVSTLDIGHSQMTAVLRNQSIGSCR